MKHLLCLFGLSLFLASCGGGGGGGSSSPSTPPPSPPPGSVWQKNVFAPASLFKDKCEKVRVGVDIEGNAFLDKAGTLLDQKNWLRSWTNETYLWNNEVIDQDPSSVTTVSGYFDILKTFAKTSSGRDKDDFHFSESTEAYLKARISTPSATYGASYISFSNTVPRDFRIRYTEPNSPASTLVGGVVNLKRGTRILSVDGVDLVNGGTTQAEIDILNNGLYPKTPNEVHVFVVQDSGSATSRSVTMTSANLSSKPVNRTAIVPTASGNVGYILFNTFSPFSSEREIKEAMDAMKAANVKDLVLDLRYNGGGLLAVASQLSYMVAGQTRTTGRFFERLKFNPTAGTRNPVTGNANNPVPFYDKTLGFSLTEGASLPTLDLGRVYILATERTCSASEAVINGLRGIGVEVVMIGDTTCGKPFGFYPQDNCGETYYTIQFQGTNDLGFGDYADGFVPNNSTDPFGVRVPGCQVADDFNNELGTSNERLLATALQFRSTGTCTPISASASLSTTSPHFSGVTLSGTIGLPVEEPKQPIMTYNRDMLLAR